MVRTRRRISDSAALIVVLFTVLALPAAAGASPLVTGFYDGNFSRADAGDRLDEAAAVGAGTVRVPVSWPHYAPKRPKRPADPKSYDFSDMDAAIAAARSRGLDVMLSIDQVPRWAEGRGRPARYRAGTYRPNAKATGQFATAVARHARGKVRYLQLLNEPNLAVYLSPQWVKVKGGFKPFAPVRYRQILNAAYPGVHKAGLKLVTAGTAPYGDPSPGGARIRPLTFWKTVLRKRARFDVLAHHPYSVGGPRQHALSPQDIAVPDVHRLAKLVGRKKPLWVTEISWDTSPPDPDGVPMERLTRWVSDAFWVLWKQGVDRVFWFQVRDQAPVGGYPATYQSGMYFEDGRPKAAAEAFAFPFACSASGGGVRIFVRAPQAGAVQIRSGDRTVRTLNTGRDRIATATLSAGGPLYAAQGDRNSPTCSP